MESGLDPLDLGEVQALFRSALKIRILLLLSRSPHTLAQIRGGTGSSSQTLIPRLRELESGLLIEQQGQRYDLTPIGYVILSQIREHVETMAVIRRHRHFLATHDMGGIPPPLLSGIRSMRWSDLICDTGSHVNRVYQNFLGILQRADHIHAVTSVMSPNMGESLATHILNGIPAELVVNADVAGKLRDPPYLPTIEILMQLPIFRVWILREPVKLGLLVTGNCISLGLFMKDEDRYDIASDLYSTDPSAIAWGDAIFRYCRERSDPFRL